MKGPSLQKTAIVSFTLHVTAFLIVFLALKQSNQMIMPSPYTVSLVSPNFRSATESRRPEVPSVQKTQTPVAASSDITSKSRKELVREKEMASSRKKKVAEQRIAELKRKREALRDIEKRRPVIPLKGGGAGQRMGMKTASSSVGKGTLFDDYYSMITRQIRQQWAFPEIGRKDMEAVVSVRILKDGTAIVQKIEKSSGNALFDRSAVKALAKASPLSPPPYEMEIGVRFFP